MAEAFWFRCGLLITNSAPRSSAKPGVQIRWTTTPSKLLASAYDLPPTRHSATQTEKSLGFESGASALRSASTPSPPATGSRDELLSEMAEAEASIQPDPQGHGAVLGRGCPDDIVPSEPSPQAFFPETR